MAYTTINNPSAYFHTQLYTGNGSSNNAITNDANSGDFKPDWLWIKSRSYLDLPMVFDSSRGRDKRIFPDRNNAEGDSSPDNFLKSFDTDGFTTGNDAGLNTNGGTLVAWQWKANGATTASNASGSITSTTQVNTTAGFSIVTYTGNGVNGATVGHSLGVVPQMIIVKRLDATANWMVYHESMGPTKAMFLDLTAAADTDAGYWSNTAPTTGIFNLGTNSKGNASGGTYIAYCFAGIQGYSKFANLRGNGNADGPFIYTGFKPAFVMQKEYSQGSTVWFMWDNKRDPINVANHTVEANSSAAEGSTASGATNWIDIVSNGYKIRNTGSHLNASGRQYIYMAFAQNPFVASDVATTAR